MNALTFDEAAAEKLVQRAAELRPLLRRNAPITESQGTLTEEVVEALAEIEVWKMAAPRRWGGLCVSANGMARVTAELAKGCPSTGWVVGVMNSALWIASVMPDAMQEELFADGIPRFCSVSAPPGSATEVDGGFMVNGAWNYASGCHQSDWIFAGIIAPEGRPGLGAAVMMPMRELEIEKTWNVAGMEGTGSDTVVARDIFVPNQRFHMLSEPLGFRAPGQKHVGEATDFWPALPLLKSKALGVIVGTAEGLLESVCEFSKDRPIQFTSYGRKVDSHVFQETIGRASAMIQGARVLMDHATSEIDRAAMACDPLSPELRARNRGETSLAIDLLVQAGTMLMDMAGSSGFNRVNDAQRYWRDLNVGARHILLIPAIGYEIVGRSSLGLEPNISPVDFI